MDKNLKKFLNKLGEESSLNFKALIKLIEDGNIPIIAYGISGGPVGIAFHNKILVDILGLYNMGYKMSYFTILHEIGHYLRLKKHPKNHIINLYKGDFQPFIDDVIYEELFADRFANLVYYKLNKQRLGYYQFRANDNNRINQYTERIRPLFNMVNTKEDYNNLVKKMTFKRSKKDFEGVI